MGVLRFGKVALAVAPHGSFSEQTRTYQVHKLIEQLRAMLRLGQIISEPDELLVCECDGERRVLSGSPISKQVKRAQTFL